MSPVLVLVGAVLFLGERLSGMRFLGVAVTLASFVGLSAAGSREGIHFHRHKWVWFLVAGTMLGGLSSLYDRLLLDRLGFDVPTVQAWFSIYLVIFFTPLMIGWKRRWWRRNEFHWRWSVAGIAISLLIADYIYFSALTDPKALVAVVTSLRRGSTLVAFVGGVLLFREQVDRRKILAVLGIILGIVLTVCG